jgi:hypothetical protein
VGIADVASLVGSVELLTLFPNLDEADTAFDGDHQRHGTVYPYGCPQSAVDAYCDHPWVGDRIVVVVVQHDTLHHGEDHTCVHLHLAVVVPYACWDLPYGVDRKAIDRCLWYQSCTLDEEDQQVAPHSCVHESALGPIELLGAAHSQQIPFAHSEKRRGQ